MASAARFSITRIQFRVCEFGPSRILAAICDGHMPNVIADHAEAQILIRAISG